MDQYLDLARTTSAQTGTSSAHSGSVLSGSEDEPAPKQRDAAKERQARKNMERIERKMGKLQTQLEKLGLEQAELASSGDYEKLATLGKQAAEIQDEIDQLEEEWMVAGEEAERWG